MNRWATLGPMIMTYFYCWWSAALLCTISIKGLCHKAITIDFHFIMFSLLKGTKTNKNHKLPANPEICKAAHLATPVTIWSCYQGRKYLKLTLCLFLTGCVGAVVFIMSHSFTRNERPGVWEFLRSFSGALPCSLMDFIEPKGERRNSVYLNAQLCGPLNASLSSVPMWSIQGKK